MALINYSRNQFQPEVLYLPLNFGGYIQLQEGSHVYPDYAASGLKNSRNPVIKNYLATGAVVIILDDNDAPPSTTTSPKTIFAPLDNTDFLGISKEVQYASLSQGVSQVSSSQTMTNPTPQEEIESNPILLDVDELLAPEIPVVTEVPTTKTKNK